MMGDLIGVMLAYEVIQQLPPNERKIAKELYTHLEKIRTSTWWPYIIAVGLTPLPLVLIRVTYPHPSEPRQLDLGESLLFISILIVAYAISLMFIRIAYYDRVKRRSRKKIEQLLTQDILTATVLTKLRSGDTRHVKEIDSLLKRHPSSNLPNK